MNALGEAIGDEQLRASAAQEQLNSRHALGLADCTQAAGPGSRSVRVHVCRPVRQSIQGLSGQVLQQGMLTRPTDTLMLQTLEILFDKPAHVIAISKLYGRNHILSKRCRQDMGAPAGVALVNQTGTNAGGPTARRCAIFSPSALCLAQRNLCAVTKLRLLSPRMSNSMPCWSSPSAKQVAGPPRSRINRCHRRSRSSCSKSLWHSLSISTPGPSALPGSTSLPERCRRKSCCMGRGQRAGAQTGTLRQNRQRAVGAEGQMVAGEKVHAALASTAALMFSFSAPRAGACSGAWALRQRPERRRYVCPDRKKPRLVRSGCWRRERSADSLRAWTAAARVQGASVGLTRAGDHLGFVGLGAELHQHLRKTHIHTGMARSVSLQARNRRQSTGCDVNGACMLPAAKSRARSDEFSSYIFIRG